MDIGTCVEDEEPLQDAPPPTPEAPPTTPEAPLATPDAPPPAPALPTSDQVQSGDTQVLSTAPPAPTPAPDRGAERCPRASPTPPPPAVATVEYTVRPGERLSDVAAFFGTTVDTIVALNGLTDPNLVVPGQRLLVPGPPGEHRSGPGVHVRVRGPAG